MPNPPIITSNGGGDAAALDLTQTWTAGATTVGVTTVVAIDAEQTGFTFSIIGGADAAHFSIDPSTGALVFVTAPNYLSPGDTDLDNIYEVIVQAWDGTSDVGGNPRVDVQTLRIKITDGHAPTIVSGGGGETATLQFPATGLTEVTTVAAVDPDPGQTVRYWIGGGADAGLFSIDYTTGLLSFLAAPDVFNPTDADGDNIYDVVVQAWDETYDLNVQYRLDSQLLHIAVQDALHAPTIVSNGGGDVAALQVVANGPNAVTTVTATDPEPDTIEYAIVGGLDAGRFTIDSATGALTFIIAPDFAAPTDSNADNLYEVNVQAWDGTADANGNARTDVQALRIAVLDNVNHAPTIVTAGGGTVATVEIDEVQYVAAIVGATDIDPGDRIVYSITGGTDAGLFWIDAATGALSFNFGAADFDSPQDANQDNIYLVNVAASDGSLSDQQALAIRVNPGGSAVTILGTAGDDTVSVVSTPAGQPFLTSLGDTVHGADGNDSLYATLGSDALYGDGGNDTFFDGDPYADPADHDAFYGGDGDDTFSGQFFWSNSFDGGAGLDTMSLQLWVAPTSATGYTFTLQAAGTVTAGFDSLSYLNVEAVNLYGTQFADNLTGGIYADLLVGGRGDDVLRGLDGDDSFVAPSGVPDVGSDIYDGGLGTDYAALIFDDIAQLTSIPALNTPSSGISFTFTPGSSDIDTAYGHKSLTSIERVYVWGTRFADTLVGGSGDDAIFAYSGADELTGGGGNDRLVGDDYLGLAGIAHSGSIANYSGNHTDYAISGVAYLTGSLRVAEATLSDLRGGSPDGTDSLRYIDLFRFADGLFTYNVTTSQWVQIGANNPPEITSDGGGDSAAVAIPENTTAVTTVAAIDPDPGATLVYSLSGGSDAALFRIDAATGALSFIAAPNFEAPGDAGANNVYDVIVHASDGSLVDDQAIAVTVTNANDAPVVAAALVDQSPFEDMPFSYTIPAGTFVDVDDSTLTLSAAQTDGTALPSWISFDALTGTFSGTPPLNSTSAVAIAVTATDPHGQSATAMFLHATNPVNDAPVAASGLASGIEDTAIAGTLVATDVDTLSSPLNFAVVTGPAHGTLSLSASNFGFNWTYSYTPDANYNGTDSFTFRASDGQLDSNIATVSLAVSPVNDAPVVTATLVDLSATQGSAFGFTLPAGTFADVDSSALALSATGLPGWLTFDPATAAFAGTPGAADVGTATITVTATDSGGLQVSDVFAITVGSGAGNVINGTNRSNTINGTGGTDTIYALGGNDTVRAGGGDDTVLGGTGNDVLYGGRGNDALNGDQGNDELFGNSGNDRLSGGDGSDRLDGGSGNDVLIGGTGFDTLFGGSGADRFVFTDPAETVVGANRDRITDFTRGSDLIDLSAIDANAGLADDQGFSWIGASGFTGVAGQLHFTRDILAGDLNGDGLADFEIRVQFSGGPAGLGVGDLLL